MRRTPSILPWLLLLIPFLGCAQLGKRTSLPEGVEAYSLRGEALRAPELPPERQAALEGHLEAAAAHHVERPGDEMAAIWHGRRLAYLGRYREALEVYSTALEWAPDSYRLLRHRGHRYVTLREFELAVADLSAASALAHDVPDEYEKDGAPNRHGIPRSTTHSNIEYHLGLAHYLLGDYEAALGAYQRCLFFSRVNDDMLVATLYWNVLTLWKLDRSGEANRLLDEVRADMDVIENDGYHQLLLFFKGAIDEEQLMGDGDSGDILGATVGYGLGAWYARQARTAEAEGIFEAVVAQTPWAAFGHIAAEAE